MTALQRGGKRLAAFITAFALVFALSALPAAASTGAQASSAAEYEQFLQTKYDVELKKTLSKGDFIQATAIILDLEATKDVADFIDLKSGDALFSAAAVLYEQGILKGPAIQAERTLTNSVAISIAVRAAGLKELAVTYSDAKVAQALSVFKTNSAGLGKPMAQELAVAIDAGFLPSEYFAGFKANAPIDTALANVLLGRVLETNGHYKNYIGKLSDADIYAKLNTAYDTSDIINAPNLQALVNEALEQELITGYNLKDSRFRANFIDELSVTYGHSDFKHAIQLLGLLRSEGLDAKVQFEPKTSAFIHMADWGDPGPNVVQIKNGNYIAFSKEYDLVFEFATAADKAKFQDVVLKYAKKNEQNQQGLIYASWWQPLYFSATKTEGYKIITNNLITEKDSPYEVHPFSLNENSAKVVAGFKAIDPDVDVTPYQFWVDVPFFNYLNGESL